MCTALIYGSVGYMNLYLFKNKPTEPHEVDLVKEIGRTNYKISCSKIGILERAGLITKSDFQTGSLLEGGGGGGLNRLAH